ncbi:MAG TPA: hypothetical protein VMH35_23285 [Streptosporangiaceae bacterium]|nr:hypothetical protein [Streptosporangiaceae bacterium]
MEFAPSDLAMLLAPLLSSPAFAATGICGFAIEKMSGVWLLGGVGVHDTVARLLPRAPYVGSVTIIACRDPLVATWLASVAEAVLHGRPPTAPSALVKPPRLPSTVADDVHSWLAGHPTGTLFLNGFVADPSRTSEDGIPGQALSLIIRLAALPGTPPPRTVQLYSPSPFWLAEPETTSEVAKLAAGIRAAANGTRHAYLHVEGFPASTVAELATIFPES